MHDDEVRAVLGSLQHTCGGTPYDVVLLPSKRDPLAVSDTLQLRFAATPINGSGKTLKFTIYAAPREAASRLSLVGQITHTLNLITQRNRK